MTRPEMASRVDNVIATYRGVISRWGGLYPVEEQQANLSIDELDLVAAELRKTCAGCASRRLGSMATGITTVSSYPFDVCALTRSRISDDWFCAGWEAADV